LSVRRAAAASLALTLAACARPSQTVQAAVFAAAGARDEAPATRFFLMGTGTLALRNAHTGERAELRYRRDDGSYDAAALAAMRRLFRSRSDQAEHDVSLRLVEILSTIQRRANAPELVLVSGYRSPALNEELRSEGRRAAGGSLHTEALAADVRVPGAELRSLWEELRRLECCGAGLYERDRFLHVDVGQPRFWEPATSRVEENLSAANARVFARTEYDRYADGEPIAVRVHAVTAAPIAIDRVASLVTADAARNVLLEVARRDEPDGGAGRTGCIDVGAGDELVVRAVAAPVRARIELRTCEPRIGKTPAVIESNPVEIR
jgi:uncharacterized protein YcbK (DUF882 family)